MNLKLIDSHCHAQFGQYDNDRDEVISRSLGAGIGMINIGTDLATSKAAIELSEKYEGWNANSINGDNLAFRPERGRENNRFPAGGSSDPPSGGERRNRTVLKARSEADERNERASERSWVWASVGLHPNDAPNEAFDEKSFSELATHPKVVAIGETGLDFYRTKGEVEHKRQLDNFEDQIALANNVKKPLSLHIRDAYEASADVLQRAKSHYGGVVHCFTGSYEEAKLFLDMGFYISITGIVTFSKSLQEVVKRLSIEKILVETDAPYLAPEPHRGKRNEPAFVEFIAKKVAEIKNVSLEHVAQATLQNTIKLFRVAL